MLSGVLHIARIWCRGRPGFARTLSGLLSGVLHIARIWCRGDPVGRPGCRWASHVTSPDEMWVRIRANGRSLFIVPVVRANPSGRKLMSQPRPRLKPWATLAKPTEGAEARAHSTTEHDCHYIRCMTISHGLRSRRRGGSRASPTGAWFGNRTGKERYGLMETAYHLI